MRHHIYLLLTFIIPVFTYSQSELQIVEPNRILSPDLSLETKAEIERQGELLSKDNLSENEQIELDSLLYKHGEVVESVYDIIDGGCSWYCGGGNYKVIASSRLEGKGENIYNAESANDLSYATAWVEGKANEGIGEYLEYYFENESPRITSIIISNGYMKSDQAWRNNNRVKSLKLYVNGSPFGILKLSDSKTDQMFSLGTFGRNEDGSDLVLKFEILEVYKGERYNDTAISEIYFDGIDVH